MNCCPPLIGRSDVDPRIEREDKIQAYEVEIQQRAERIGKWDQFYIGMAQYIATASKDPSTKVGAVIVRPNNTVMSVGYNGFPRGMSDDPSLYADRETKYSRIVHAEMNAILNAHGPVEGCTLYCTFTPCDRCAVFVVQSGITRVVSPEPTSEQLERWGTSLAATRAIFQEAGVMMTTLSSEE